MLRLVIQSIRIQDSLIPRVAARIRIIQPCHQNIFSFGLVCIFYAFLYCFNHQNEKDFLLFWFRSPVFLSMSLLFLIFFIWDMFVRQPSVFLIRASHLCGGVVVSIGDPHRHVVVGASSRVEPAGDGDGSCVSLDVEVLFFIASWGMSRQTETWIPSGYESGRVQLSDVISQVICHAGRVWFWLVAGMMRPGIDLQRLNNRSDFPEGGAVINDLLSNFGTPLTLVPFRGNFDELLLW